MNWLRWKCSHRFCDFGNMFIFEWVDQILQKYLDFDFVQLSRILNCLKNAQQFEYDSNASDSYELAFLKIGFNLLFEYSI